MSKIMDWLLEFFKYEPQCPLIAQGCTQTGQRPEKDPPVAAKETRQGVRDTDKDNSLSHTVSCSEIMVGDQKMHIGRIRTIFGVVNIAFHPEIDGHVCTPAVGEKWMG